MSGSHILLSFHDTFETKVPTTFLSLNKNSFRSLYHLRIWKCFFSIIFKATLSLIHCCEINYPEIQCLKERKKKKMEAILILLVSLQLSRAQGKLSFLVHTISTEGARVPGCSITHRQGGNTRFLLDLSGIVSQNTFAWFLHAGWASLQYGDWVPRVREPGRSCITF